MATIKAGTMLSFSGGEYSDRWTNGPFSVLRDFDQAAVIEEYKSAFVKRNEWDAPDEYGFGDFLIRAGYIEDVPESYCWYVGAYGEFSPVIS